MSLDLLPSILVLMRGILWNIGGRQKSMVSTYFSRRRQDICKFEIRSFRSGTWVEIPHRARKEKRLSLPVMRLDLLQYGLPERLLAGGRYSYWHVPTWSSTYTTVLGSRLTHCQQPRWLWVVLPPLWARLNCQRRMRTQELSRHRPKQDSLPLAVYVRDCPEDCVWLSFCSQLLAFYSYKLTKGGKWEAEAVEVVASP